MSNLLHVFNQSCQVAGVVKGRCIVHVNYRLQSCSRNVVVVGLTLSSSTVHLSLKI